VRSCRLLFLSYPPRTWFRPVGGLLICYHLHRSVVSLALLPRYSQFPSVISAVGFVYSWSRFSSIFTGFMVAGLLASYGVTGVFVFIAAAMVLICAIVGFWGPKTNGVRLEAIAR
jgi:MFS transporter, putative metabolite:H+ symporter